MEICNQCGNSVAWGSGRYVNRIPSDWGSEQLAQPFPNGKYICGICLEKEAEKQMGS